MGFTHIRFFPESQIECANKNIKIVLLCQPKYLAKICCAEKKLRHRVRQTKCPSKDVVVRQVVVSAPIVLPFLRRSQKSLWQ
jgi:hypothetical protein